MAPDKQVGCLAGFAMATVNKIKNTDEVLSIKLALLIIAALITLGGNHIISRLTTISQNQVMVIGLIEKYHGEDKTEIAKVAQRIEDHINEGKKK